MSDSEYQEPENLAKDESTFERFCEEQQREVDRISIELLSNTKHYKKYIAKNHPEEQLKRDENRIRFLKYKSRIVSLFIELINEYENIEDYVDVELQTVFKECVQKTIQHLEWTDHNQTAASLDAEFADVEDDVMFSSKYLNRRMRQPSTISDPFSYWGATIRKSEESP